MFDDEYDDVFRCKKYDFVYLWCIRNYKNILVVADGLVYNKILYVFLLLKCPSFLKYVNAGIVLWKICKIWDIFFIRTALFSTL